MALQVRQECWIVSRDMEVLVPRWERDVGFSGGLGAFAIVWDEVELPLHYQSVGRRRMM